MIAATQGNTLNGTQDKRLSQLIEQSLMSLVH